MKNFVLLVFAGLLCLCTFSQDLSQDLIVHYNFNGNVEDQGPNGLDGIGTIAYTTDPFGVAGQAGEFNGVDDFIDLPNEEIVEASFPMSVAFWLKIYTTDPQKNVFFTNDFALNNHSGMWVNLTSTNRLTVSVGDASGSTGPNDRRSKQGETVLEINTWYHVVAVVNGFNDMQLYLNCENDGGTYSGSANSLGYTSAPGSVGRKDIANFNTYHFSGVMDDFYYWNRVVTPEEMGFLCESNICDFDTEGPDFLNPPENMNIECGEVVPEPMEVNPSDDSGIASLDFQEELIFDGCFNDIERTWISEDVCGNQSQITQLINIIDITPPELSYGPEDLVLNCRDNIPVESAIFIDNCDQNLNIDLEQEFNESSSQCTLANPQDQGLTANYSLYLNNNEEVLLFSLESSTLEFSSDSSEMYISATFVSQTDNSSGYFMYAEFENGLNWENWSSQDHETSFKDGLELTSGEHIEWSYFLLSNDSYLDGWGSFEGSLFQMDHQPESQYYGFQLGEGANNVNANFGLGGWFFFSNFDNSISGTGDLSFDLDCCDDESLTNIWTATDCSGNTSEYTQNIQFNATVSSRIYQTDLDQDRLIGTKDLLTFLPVYNEEGLCGRCDFNHDQLVNVDDFLVLLSDFGILCSE